MPLTRNSLVSCLAVAVSFGAILFFPRKSFPQASKETQYDLVIINCHILDGTGSPWYEGSVAVKDGKIAEIGRLGNVRAKRTIDAKGLIVAPGFIDLRGGLGPELLVDGKAESKIRQGITTDILGESFSPGPLLGPAIPEAEGYFASLGLKRTWSTLGEFFSTLQKHGTAMNVASYVGANLVRIDVMGNVNHPPTPDELNKMRTLVDEGMRDGAIGLSAALLYPPASFFKTDELVELAKVAGRYGGIYTSHIRNESDQEADALREAIEIGEKGGLPVHIFHFKMAGKHNWGKIGEMIALIQAARDRGLDITADQYPYTAGQTGLALVLPPKYGEGTTEQIIDRLKDPNARLEIRKLIETGAPGWEDFVLLIGGWHNAMISSVQKAENKQYEGKRMDEIAKRMGKDPVDAVCDLLISEEMHVDAIYFEDDERDVREAMQEPWVGIGSDAEAVNPGMKFMGKPHPRYYGNFPRVLGYYVRDQKVLALPDAIRKMTSLPAQIIGLTDRGLLRPGMAADITIFDPEKVSDKATYEDPFQYPVGIPYVIVNGTIVIDQGKHTGVLPGSVLYGRGKREGKATSGHPEN
jgi:dihydroorotase/N-acyl-D-amino-acid deacylase